jgi:hypothetical protein
MVHPTQRPLILAIDTEGKKWYNKKQVVIAAGFTIRQVVAKGEMKCFKSLQ